MWKSNFSDSKSAISIANNLVQHDRTKQVDVDHHFIEEKLEEGVIYMPLLKLRSNWPIF